MIINGLEVRIKKGAKTENLLRYAIAVLMVATLVIAAVLIFKSEGTEVSEVSKPSRGDILFEIDEFKINWRSFVGF